MDEQGFFESGYNAAGYDRDGYDREGFNRLGIHKNGTKYDGRGYDCEGYDHEGYDRDGYNREGYDHDGYNKRGYDREGYDVYGYNKQGYDRDGYNRQGFNKDGIHKDTGEEYDLEGINDRGLTKEEFELILENRKSNYVRLLEKAHNLAAGKLSVEKFIMTSKKETTIEELIRVAKDSLTPNEIRKIRSLNEEYKAKIIPFTDETKEKMLASLSIEMPGQEHIKDFTKRKYVKPTEEDIAICKNYLMEQGRLVCKSTMYETVRKYLRGELDLSGLTKENVSNSRTQANEELIELLKKQENVKEKLGSEEQELLKKLEEIRIKKTKNQQEIDNIKKRQKGE